ncbi:PRC-barrel domain-containing protein [Streptomyces cacaoi]|uniref:PRC-barrel domain-containing protein n=1 Tax=Streptomyces cacaoi TaxID=1898 RepID=UPI0026263E87|nr:PRC-barrel domain-containing protein [Streptomyces cacaoi]
MFEPEDIREWRGRNVVDESGSKIGSMESVYVDTASDRPSFATVTVGMPTKHRLVFVPLAGATVGPDYLKVKYDKGAVKDAPWISPDGELPADREAAVFAHYDLHYTPGASGERRLARR